jgi:hypothetical protein
LRSLVNQPSPAPPVSERDLARYANKWVVVRGERVVLHADSHDALVAMRPTSRRFKNDNDRIVHLPPRSISTEPESTRYRPPAKRNPEEAAMTVVDPTPDDVPEPTPDPVPDPVPDPDPQPEPSPPDTTAAPHVSPLGP